MPDTIIAGSCGQPVIIDTGGFNVAGYTLSVEIEGPIGPASRTFNPHNAVTALADNLHVQFIIDPTDPISTTPGDYLVQPYFTLSGTNIKIGAQDTLTVLPAV